MWVVPDVNWKFQSLTVVSIPPIRYGWTHKLWVIIFTKLMDALVSSNTNLGRKMLRNDATICRKKDDTIVKYGINIFIRTSFDKKTFTKMAKSSPFNFYSHLRGDIYLVRKSLWMRPGHGVSSDFLSRSRPKRNSDFSEKKSSWCSLVNKIIEFRIERWSW